MKIVQKGLLIVLLPVLVNGVWISILSLNLYKTVQLAEAERKEAALVDKLNLLIQRYYETTGTLMTLYSTSNPNMREVALRAVNQMKSLISELEESTNLTKRQMNILTQSYAFFDSQIDSVANFTADGSESGLSKFVTFRKEFVHSAKRAIGDRTLFNDFLLPQHEEVDQLRRSQTTSRNALNVVVATGFVVNVFLATILALMFNRHVTTRLNALVENAAFLSKQTPLKPLPDGDDEFNVLDAAMQKAAEELKEANLYRNSLMQMVAHDLRSPLTSSQLTLDVLLEEETTTMTEGTIKKLNRMRSNNLRLIALVNDLLTLESLQTGQLDIQRGKFSVRDTVDECLNVLNSLAQAKKITISNLCQTEEIFGDQKRIVQVLINFLTNAIKFSPPGSDIQVLCRREGSNVNVSVVDRGVGISKSDQVRIFERFYQSKDGKAGDGFGLGLAICKLIIEAHEGKIGVSSERGKGSSFWFKVRAA